MKELGGAFCYLVLTAGAVFMCYGGYMAKWELDSSGDGMPYWMAYGFGLVMAALLLPFGHQMTWRWLVDTGHIVAIGVLMYFLYINWNVALLRGDRWWLAICLITPAVMFLSGIVYRATRGPQSDGASTG